MEELAALTKAQTELVHSIDTVWVAICAALIFQMEGGFALLEAGFVRSKNAVSIIAKVMIDIMFGGIAFMRDDRMFAGIVRDDLMVRVPHDQYEEVLTRPYVRPMDFTARPMKGFIYVAWEGLQAQPALLRTYLQLGLAYLDSPEGRAAAAKKAKTKK